MTRLEQRKARESLLSAQFVRSILDYVPETGVLTWKSVRSTRVLAGDPAGGLNKAGYRCIEIHDQKFMAHRLAWLIVHGRWPDFDIDHVNGDRSDNRLSNLREASRSENCANRSLRTGSVSGFKGVHWNKKLGKWQVGVKKGGIRRYVGLFSELEEAAAAYRRAASELHGEFARSS